MLFMIYYQTKCFKLQDGSYAKHDLPNHNVFNCTVGTDDEEDFEEVEDNDEDNDEDIIEDIKELEELDL